MFAHTHSHTVPELPPTPVTTDWWVGVALSRVSLPLSELRRLWPCPDSARCQQHLCFVLTTTKSWEARRDIWSDCGEDFWGVQPGLSGTPSDPFRRAVPYILSGHPQLHPGFSSEIKNPGVSISWYRLSTIVGLFVFWHPLRQSLGTNKPGALSAHPTSLPQPPLWRVMLSGDGWWEGFWTTNYWWLPHDLGFPGG